MAASKYVSNIKVIDRPIESVFTTLSNFENLSAYLNEDVLSAVSEKVPMVEIRNFQSDPDSCRFDIGNFGNTEIRIVERTPFTTIKIHGEGGIPMELTLWIQLLPQGEEQTRMRLTLQTEMGMMIKMMVGNKLEAGLDKLADSLASLPYP